MESAGIREVDWRGRQLNPRFHGKIAGYDGNSSNAAPKIENGTVKRARHLDRRRHGHLARAGSTESQMSGLEHISYRRTKASSPIFHRSRE